MIMAIHNDESNEKYNQHKPTFNLVYSLYEQ